MILQEEDHLFSTSEGEGIVSNVLTLGLWQYNDLSICTTTPVPPSLMGVCSSCVEQTSCMQPLVNLYSCSLLLVPPAGIGNRILPGPPVQKYQPLL